MKLEQQVISLSLAKRLKELGVKQEGQCWWSEHTIPQTLWYEGPLEVAMEGAEKGDVWERYAAFTVAELLEMAPASTSLLKRTDIKTNTIPRYYVETFEHYRDSDWNENPAEALGLMLAYLIENKLLAPNEEV